MRKLKLRVSPLHKATQQVRKRKRRVISVGVLVLNSVFLLLHNEVVVRMGRPEGEEVYPGMAAGGWISE
jgi:hypothetical protein